MEELEDALKKKDEDMKQMEERYKKYLEKAKSVSGSSLLLLPTPNPEPHNPHSEASHIILTGQSFRR